MKSAYGNEWKNLHLNTLGSKQISQLADRLKAPPPLVLNVSHWECGKNWNVPPRRIMDNLILIVRSGRIRVQIEDVARILNPGEYALIPENAQHSYGLAPGEEACSNYVLHLLPLLQNQEQQFARFKSLFRRLHHPEALFEQLDQGIALRNQHRTLADSFVAQLVRLMEREAVLDGEYSDTESTSPDARVEKMLAFIQRNHTADISIPDIAAEVQLKEVQFRRIFQRETGMSPIHYLHRQRLLHAIQLLLRSSCTLEEIARSSGFHSASYLCRSFQKFYRMTPAEFRDSYR